VKLIHPVGESAQRSDNQVRAEVALLLAEQRDESNGLNGFA